MNAKYWRDQLQHLLEWEEREHAERVAAFKAISDNLDRLPVGEIRSLVVHGTPGDIVPLAQRMELLNRR